MNQKKARLLRKSLGMTKENLRTAEYNKVKHGLRLTWVRDRLGELKPVETERFTLINTSKAFYRQQKKALKRG